MAKKKYSKYAKDIKKGVEGLSKTYKKYAPTVKKAGIKTHKFLRASAEAISDSLTPMPHKGQYLDVGRKQVKVKSKKYSPKLKKVRETKGGFYLDFT